MSKAVEKIKDLATNITNSALLLADRTNDWQAIKEYLSNRSNDLPLTQMQKDKLERYQFVYNQLSTGKFIEKEVLNQLGKTYGISITQAIQDLSDAKELYGFLFNINKMFELKVQLDINRLMMEKAKASNDLKGYAALEKNRIEMMKIIPEIEDAPGEYFTPHINKIVFDPALIGAPKDIDMKALLDEINKRHNKALDTELITEAEVIPNEGK